MNAAHYCTNLADSQAVAKLVQSAVTASATIAFAQKNLNPEDWATVPDWMAVRRELLQALQAIGHPAGVRQLKCPPTPPTMPQ